MIDMQESAFSPDYTVPTGEILEEYLETAGMSQAELAQRTGLTPKTVNKIVQGRAPLTHDTAIRLERVLGRPAHFWNRLEADYRETLARRRAREAERKELDWVKKFPIRKMVELGWLPKGRNPTEELENLLRYFGVNSPREWADLWSRQTVAYRRTQSFEAVPEALFAWLRQGELQGRARACEPYDPAAFRALLKELRGLTREPPEVFQPRLRERCAGVGVTVEFVPELPKSRASGATRWLSPQKALIQLSLRYCVDDHLWFSFFHEAGHVLLHGKREMFVEGTNGLDGEKEQEADRFAADLLIPRRVWDDFVAAGKPSLAQVCDLADRLGVAPGIVVGRLQFEGISGWNWGNKLKQRFTWRHRMAQCNLPRDP